MFATVVRDEGTLNVPFLLFTLLLLMNVPVFSKSWINISAVLLEKDKMTCVLKCKGKLFHRDLLYLSESPQHVYIQGLILYF